MAKIKDGKERMTKVKWLTSYQKECRWLEEMAQQGWLFENMTLGIIYKFYRDEPKRMLYEIDRFSLPAKPTLEEIQHKELFMEMAEELGWKEVTHDEGMTYYFCKEYEEGGINELYNEEESRRYRAKKFSSFYKNQAMTLIYAAMAIAIVDILLLLESKVVPDVKALTDWYNWFTLAYVVFTCGFSIYVWKVAARFEKELSMTRKEWEDSVNPSLHKTKRKLVLTVRGLSRMLKKEAEKGWVLESVTPMKYSFKKSEGGEQIYVMDSKWLTNRRLKKAGRDVIEDRKDWTGISNDWQLQSVKDAQAKGWQFVCALENRTIIYRGEADKVEPLNEAKYDYSLRSTSLIGEYGVWLVLCGLIGALCGFLIAYFSFI